MVAPETKAPTARGRRRDDRFARGDLAASADCRGCRDRTVHASSAPDVVIGPGTWIGPHAVINGPTRIGADNKIFQFASIGDAPQDKKYKGEPTRLEIGDRNVFRESVTVNRGTTHDKGVTRIGNDNLLMAYSHVAHDCSLGDQIVMANCATLGGHVEIGDWVIMGGLSAVHQFTKVGEHSFLAHNAMVTRDVPPFVMAVGRPRCRTA